MVDILEWTWTAIATFGVVVCLWALVDCYLDHRDLIVSHRNGDALAVVKMNLRSARASLVLHIFFLILGIAALVTPDEPVNIAIVIFAIGYITAAGTNIRAILLNQIDRINYRRR